MVTLFMGLYAAAGVRPEKEGRAPAIRTSSAAPRPRPQINSSRAKVPAPKSSKVAPPASFTGLHPMLAALLADLPAPGTGWTKEKRDKVVGMFPTVLDFAFPIVEEDEQTRDEDE
jgi:hypothetical protein